MIRSHLNKIVMLVILCFIVQFIAPLAPAADAEEVAQLELNVNAAILMDAETGQILYGINENKPYQPASMTKMMTEYLVMEEIKAGNLNWDDMIITTDAADDAIGSGQLMARGVSYPARKVFELLSIYSGNDAAVAFAEHIAGTEEQFAIRMNEMAKQLGLSEASHFINSTGLSRRDMGTYAPSTIEGETLLTAQDAAILAQRIVLEHPEVLETAKIPQLKFEENDSKPMVNWNWMVEGNKENVNLSKYAYEGLDGLKTGHTSDAGYCFTGTAKRNGMRLISVIMGAKSEDARFMETRKLLDYGFLNFEKKTIILAKSELPEVKTVFIRNGTKQNIPIIIGESIEIIAKKTNTSEPQLTVQLLPEDQLMAPLKVNDQVGTVIVEYAEMKYEVPLLITEDVEKASWIRIMLRAINRFFSGMIEGIGKLF
jgi:D-alanyl-D-alanine carboxypeptidase (penicillin-binding protein 5/6)